jgi:hypothetical protein
MTHHDHQTHEFDCKQCGAHLDSRDELDRHNRDNHGQQAGSSGSDSPGERERGAVGSEGGGDRFGSGRSDIQS